MAPSGSGRSAPRRPVTPSWPGTAPTVAPQLRRPVGGDQRARGQRGLDDHGDLGERGHDPVARGEVVATAAPSPAGRSATIAPRLDDPAVEARVATRVDDVGPAGEHGDRRPPAIERTPVGGRVDPARHPADHRDPGERELARQLARRPAARSRSRCASRRSSPRSWRSRPATSSRSPEPCRRGRSPGRSSVRHVRVPRLARRRASRRRARCSCVPPPQAERLRHVVDGDLIAPAEVGQGPRDPQGPLASAAAEPRSRADVGQQPLRLGPDRDRAGAAARRSRPSGHARPRARGRREPGRGPRSTAPPARGTSSGPAGRPRG